MNPEDELPEAIRGALHGRADQVEPATDSYARLAQRVGGSHRRPPTPWWQSARFLWLGAAGTLAVVVLVAVILVLDDDDNDTLVANPPDAPTTDPASPTTPVPSPASTAEDVPTPPPTTTSVPSITPTPPPSGQNQGRPEGVAWPVESIQPFGEWPSTPEDAAQAFMSTVGGWPLPLGDVTFLDPIAMIADVTLQFLGEDGVGSGEATRVRVLGGFDENGNAQWGVAWAQSNRINVASHAFDGLEYVPSGTGWAFEGTIDVTLVSPSGEIAGGGFVMGGGVELAPLNGSVSITNNLPGHGFAVLADLGGLGTPSALTIHPIVIPDVSDVPVDDPSLCSASELEPPAADAGIPEAVETTRQLIAELAIACDFDGLAAVTEPGNFTFSFGVNDDPAGFWRLSEANGNEPLRFLVETLRLPVAEDGTAGTLFYVWPDVFLLDWSTVTPEQMDNLRPLYTDPDFQSFSDFGGFFSYRVAIDDQGAWRFFVAGD